MTDASQGSGHASQTPIDLKGKTLEAGVEGSPLDLLVRNAVTAGGPTSTMARLCAGTLVGTIPGLVLGLTIGLFRTPRAVVNPLISVTYGLPRVALFPLVLLIVGLNEASNVIMVALGPFFTMLIGSAAAVQNVDPDLPEGRSQLECSYA